MRQLSDIGGTIVKKHAGKNIQVAMLASSVIGDFIEALKPELELMLKEQANLVRNEAAKKVDWYVRFYIGLPFSELVDDMRKDMLDLQHPWVNLDEGAG